MPPLTSMGVGGCGLVLRGLRGPAEGEAGVGRLEGLRLGLLLLVAVSVHIAPRVCKVLAAVGNTAGWGAWH